MGVDVRERARNKAFAKIARLYLDVQQLKNDLEKQDSGIISMEDLATVYISTKRELKTWNYIATVIEKDEQ